MAEHTPYQKKIIEGYYEHRDGIMLDKLGEIVTELFLAESTRQRDQLWTHPGREGHERAERGGIGCDPYPD